MSDYEPKVGDRVRVVLEGDVDYAGVLSFRLSPPSPVVWRDDQNLVSVEKVEPPVEVFGPGTLVKSKKTGWLYTVGDKGFYDHRLNEPVRVTILFTSKHYTRVEVPS